MKNIFVMTLFLLTALALASAQQPRTSGAGTGQAASPGPQTPGATQTPPTMPPDSAGQQGGMTSQTVTEGCLGGTAPNYTLTDKSGTTYKLNIPANADASKLAAHIGESVAVAGNVNGKSSIDVQGIGRGNGSCPGSGKTGAQTPPPQQ
jgi:hypothetical protein